MFDDSILYMQYFVLLFATFSFLQSGLLIQNEIVFQGSEARYRVSSAPLWRVLISSFLYNPPDAGILRHNLNRGLLPRYFPTENRAKYSVHADTDKLENNLSDYWRLHPGRPILPRAGRDAFLYFCIYFGDA